MGYHRAGFEVVGVDIMNQKHYPFEFHQADALTYPLEGFDVIHASPPCQGYTRMAQGLLESQGRGREYPKLIELVREKLEGAQVPYVIENVPGSPLISPTMLCGSSFGLLVQRHRLFESNKFFMGAPCYHDWQKSDKPPLHRLQGKSRVVGCYGNGRGKGDNRALWAQAMGIDWMTRKEMSQAIPPAYTEWIGRQLMEQIWPS